VIGLEIGMNIIVPPELRNFRYWSLRYIKFELIFILARIIKLDRVTTEQPSILMQKQKLNYEKNVKFVIIL
jgi:hypothetical protein